jgi:hypothetical protein
MRPVVLINSGSYLPQELSAEFGPLPPTFLPVGMGRLYELQLESVSVLAGDVYLSLPDSFQVPDWDAERLSALGVNILRTPDGVDIGPALLTALAAIGFADRPLHILHGDTLVTNLDASAEDALAVARGADGYRWAVALQTQGKVTRITTPELVEDPADQLRVTGYFAFASLARFAAKLGGAGGDFFEALNAYARSYGLEARLTEGWLDFGHVQTYFRSRRVVTTQRAFNTLEISDTTVRKKSAQVEKLKAEVRWFRGVPDAMKPYTARLIGEHAVGGSFAYETEYEYLPTLAELFVFSRLTPGSWARILRSCQSFLDLSAGAVGAAPAVDVLGGLALDKAHSRLEEFARQTGFDLDAPNRFNGSPAPSLRQCVEDVAARLQGEPARPSVMHGDFCFSNILFDFRTQRIRVIDPRGALSEESAGLLGDVRYDAAKLMHSIVGLYDVIIAGRFAASQPGTNAFELRLDQNPDRERLAGAALGMSMGGVPLRSPAVAAVVLSLFLSMLPLHADRPDRQIAFAANALRLRLGMDAAA